MSFFSVIGRSRRNKCTKNPDLPCPLTIVVDEDAEKTGIGAVDQSGCKLSGVTSDARVYDVIVQTIRDDPASVVPAENVCEKTGFKSRTVRELISLAVISGDVSRDRVAPDATNNTRLPASVSSCTGDDDCVNRTFLYALDLVSHLDDGRQQERQQHQPKTTREAEEEDADWGVCSRAIVRVILKRPDHRFSQAEILHELASSGRGFEPAIVFSAGLVAKCLSALIETDDVQRITLAKNAKCPRCRSPSRAARYSLSEEAVDYCDCGGVRFALSISKAANLVAQWVKTEFGSSPLFCASDVRDALGFENLNYVTKLLYNLKKTGVVKNSNHAAAGQLRKKGGSGASRRSREIIHKIVPKRNRAGRGTPLRKKTRKMHESWRRASDPPAAQK